jgi:hypothetical protein
VNKAQKKKRHQWTEKEWLYCLYIAKYVPNEWNDFIRRNRIDVRIYGREGEVASVRMGCENFRYLLTQGKKGLKNVSNLQKKVFNNYENWSNAELHKILFQES